MHKKPTPVDGLRAPSHMMAGVFRWANPVRFCTSGSTLLRSKCGRRACD